MAKKHLESNALTIWKRTTKGNREEVAQLSDDGADFLKEIFR